MLLQVLPPLNHVDEDGEKDDRDKNDEEAGDEIDEHDAGIRPHSHSNQKGAIRFCSCDSKTCDTEFLKKFGLASKTACFQFEPFHTLLLLHGLSCQMTSEARADLLSRTLAKALMLCDLP